MDLTPETLRSATFRDKLRGYHPDDVDEFLESVARGLEVLLARLRDATEKARAPVPSPEAPSQSDEAVKTLVLAQRTADLAIHEAKAEAERLVKAAEQKARRLLSEAEDSAAQAAEQAQADLRADLEKLQAAREQLFGEVRSLGSWLEAERGRIRRALIEVADRLADTRGPGDAPAAKPVSVPTPPRQKLERERAGAPNASASNTPASKPPAPAAAPPVERPRAAATPPPAAPAPYQKGNTPPGGQPAVQPPKPKPEPEPTVPRQVVEPSDAAVLHRAQEGLVSPGDEEDPFFAELRAAMKDQSPLGPRDDDQTRP